MGTTRLFASAPAQGSQQMFVIELAKKHMIRADRTPNSVLYSQLSISDVAVVGPRIFARYS